jgi:hypothetical protein
MQMMVSNSGVFAFVTVNVSSTGGETEAAKVEVPFDFMVGERVLRAGLYEMEESGTPGLLRFRCQAHSDQAVLVQSINGSRAESVIPEKLLFLVQRNTYYLGQALMATV